MKPRFLDAALAAAGLRDASADPAPRPGRQPNLNLPQRAARYRYDTAAAEAERSRYSGAALRAMAATKGASAGRRASGAGNSTMRGRAVR